MLSQLIVGPIYTKFEKLKWIEHVYAAVPCSDTVGSNSTCMFSLNR